LAKEIIHTYVATAQFCCMCRKQDMECDSQFENGLLLNKYFLLYEELSYAMYRDDISWVKASIISWIPILKAVRKHKYAMQMTTFLCNVHFIYPSGL
ncbi:hypothetical protein F5J12DRAFT_682056, partial [Pisolithus orientalis]|uniref:uncharacterized protein n=1 Tax=Pisolithus orientalis TaxID=936130 RepID=UPI0022244185